MAGKDIVLSLRKVLLKRRFRPFLAAGLAGGLLALAIGIVISTGQSCKGPADGLPVARTAGSQIGERPYLGVTYVPISAHMAAYYGLSTSSGVLITAIAEGSPAEKAGLQIDDVIIEFADQVLSSEVTIIDLLNRGTAGERVEAGVVRNGELLRIELTLAARLGN